MKRKKELVFEDSEKCRETFGCGLSINLTIFTTPLPTNYKESEEFSS